jgi:hypothetical protein
VGRRRQAPPGRRPRPGGRFTELGSDALLDNTLGQQAHRACGFEERERVVCFRKRI